MTTPDTSVVWHHSGMTGAPSLSGTAGAMIALLDAVLVNGWGSATVDSVAIASGVGTVTRSAGHPFEIDSVAEISGATVTGGSINGRHKVLSVDSTHWTFDATGLSDQTATGTIYHKVAAAGWEKHQSGTNLAGYRSTNVASSQSVLRVDDTGTTSARVKGFLTMSNVNTGEDQFPTDTQVSGGQYWSKSNQANSNSRGWIIVGDDRFFYIAVIKQGSSLTSGNLYIALNAFGDPLSVKSPDPYRAYCHGDPSDNSGSSTPANIVSYHNQQAGYLCRGVSGLGTAVGSAVYSTQFSGLTGGFSGSGNLLYPNTSDNGLYVVPMAIVSQSVLRSWLPGLYYCPQAGVYSSMLSNTRTPNVNLGTLGTRTLKSITGEGSVTFFDVTGPWR